jgi:adenylate kinase
LIEYYIGRRRLIVVNGIGHPDAVFDRLVRAVESNRP